MRSAIASGFGSTPVQDELRYTYDEPQINAVSFSRLNVFETCGYRALLAYSKKIPEIPHTAPKENALERGSRVHDSAYKFVIGEGELIPEMETFAEEFEILAERYRDAPDTIEVEQMWQFDKDWGLIETPEDFDDFSEADWQRWKQIWMRVKQDAIVLPEPTRVVAIDYKTGRKEGNQVKHNLQLRIALLGAMFKYPQAQTFVGENWYLDANAHVPTEFTRDQLLKMYEELDGRLRAVTTATDFTPKASRSNCRWCPYRTGKLSKYQEGTGTCKEGYAFDE